MELSVVRGRLAVHEPGPEEDPRRGLGQEAVGPDDVGRDKARRPSRPLAVLRLDDLRLEGLVRHDEGGRIHALP